MKKKLLAIALCVIIIIGAGLWLILKPARVQALYGNGQMGIIVRETEEITVNGKTVPVYRTTSEQVKILFESRNLDNNYENQIIINGYAVLPLKAGRYSHKNFISNEIALIGPNIVSGKLEIIFKAGRYLSENLNTFSIRNVRIQVAGKEFWSEEYPEAEYFNEPINLGENGMNQDLRSNFRESVSFTFHVDEKLLKKYGAVLEDFEGEELEIVSGNRIHKIKNEAHIGIDCNINDGEVISETKKLQVTADAEWFEVKMDGIPIPPNLTFSRHAWSEGTHDLEIRARNEHGFEKTKTLSFSLTGKPEVSGKLSYRVYKTGVAASPSATLEDLGAELSDISAFLETDGNYDRTPFSEAPVISFVVERGKKTALVWKGKANEGRTAFMQLYNFEENLWETVSTARASGETLTLAYDYLGEEKYLFEDAVYVRISSAFTDFSGISFSDRLIHGTDFQYITQMLSLSEKDSAVWKKAKAAFDAMVQYLLWEHETEKLRYFLMTGDFVQQQRGVTLSEWENVRTHFLDPLLASGLPLGVSSGNHDVGAISSYHPKGVNALDSELVYDYFWDYLGEDVFKDFPHYGESFQNNRSHYDLLTVDGHPFLILYLGWGSSFPYVHVSSQDIAWAKAVLDAHPDCTVILATHEYLRANGTRTPTGEKVFSELVKEYGNVKFVFSGHLNGSAKLIDYLDDDGDGIADRRVLQLLTNFQEEEDLYGATFFRTIDFDFRNNLLLFGLYSPYYRDSDLFLSEDSDHYRETLEFHYAFDLQGRGYGILTDYFG
ncbi:MAG: hypothetical protein WAP91_06835 [Bacilli bacterium]